MFQTLLNALVTNEYIIESLSKFVTDVIKKFDTLQLRDSLSRRPDGLLNQFVVEFYKKSGLLSNGVISCEVGSQFGLTGRIDIYINHGLNFGKIIGKKAIFYLFITPSYDYYRRRVY